MHPKITLQRKTLVIDDDYVSFLIINENLRRNNRQSIRMLSLEKAVRQYDYPLNSIELIILNKSFLYKKEHELFLGLKEKYRVPIYVMLGENDNNVMKLEACNWVDGVICYNTDFEQVFEYNNQEFKIHAD